MGCNWELYEFRVRVFYKLGDKSIPRHGSRYVGVGSQFFDVFPDLKTLGIGNFQGSNNNCDFKSVFNQLIKLKMIPFNCPQGSNTGNHFSRIQIAERDKEHLPAAKLYVHKRNDSELSSETTGIGIWMEGVDVVFTSASNGAYYIQLIGDDAGSVNY